MRINATPTDLIDQLRAWFHPKDRSIVMADDCFIEGDEISTPSNPRAGRRRLYAKNGCWYDLDSSGTETSLCANNIIDRWGDVVSSWMLLPGLVGFWPFSSVQRSTGNAYDVSGQNRILTYNGNPTYNIYNNFVPYIDFDGVGDFLSRADETDLDVLGTEAINAAAVCGLTLGGWYWFNNAPAAQEVLISKGDGNVAGIAYWLDRLNTGEIRFIVGNGIALTTTNTITKCVASTWYHICAVYVPSTSIKIYLNGILSANLAVGIPANLANNAFPLNLSGYNNSGFLLHTGRQSLITLEHQSISSSLVNAMFQQSRVLFGV